MPNRLAPTIRASLDKVFRLHNGHGVQISQIRCDNEFRSLFEPIKDDLDVEMEYTAAQDHQNEAERNNRFIKERVRSSSSEHRGKKQSIEFLTSSSTTSSTTLDIAPCGSWWRRRTFPLVSSIESTKGNATRRCPMRQKLHPT